MAKKLLLSAIILITSFSYSFAQVGQGSLKGKVLDKSTGEPLPFVNIALEQGGVPITGGTTDFDGAYNIKPIAPGEYTLKVQFVGYKTVVVNGLLIKSSKITFYDAEMISTTETLETFEVIQYTVPLIDKDGGATGRTVTREEIGKMATRSATGVAATVGGVYSKDDGSGDLNIRGSRSDANYYFIDGIKVRGSTSLPKSAIEQVTVITGGVPAQYGDITGGVISITTRGASREFGGGIEYLTSGAKFGANSNPKGLDAYGYNLLEFSLSGPALMKKDSTGAKTKPLIGFFISANVTSVVDQSPSYIGNWKLKDGVASKLSSNPLRTLPGQTSSRLNSEYLRLSDFQKIKTAQNVTDKGLNLNGKLVFNLGKNMDLAVGAGANLRSRNLNSYSYSLANNANKIRRTDQAYRGYVRFTQRLGEEDPTAEKKSASNIKNIYYSLQLDYNKTGRNQWDNRHKNNYFNYGYIGKFQRFQTRTYSDTITVDGVTMRGQSAFSDTLIGYRPGTINPELSKLTSDYYSQYGWGGYVNGKPTYNYAAAQDLNQPGIPNFPIARTLNIQSSGGLINGQQPRDIYGLWRSPGYTPNAVTKFNRNQTRFTATGSADIKDHAITIGFAYEQRSDRQYQIFPVGTSTSATRSLWTRARQLTNLHLAELDKSEANRTVDFNTGLVSYERKNADAANLDKNPDYTESDVQSFFDYNLRKELGLSQTGNDFIDIDNLDPTKLKLNYFSPDELYSNGYNSSIVSYYGYDAYGNQTGKSSLNDFFNSVDKYGNHNRSIGAFQPIYMAGYIQDKFSYKDLVFNVGVRVDRFDANQKVLIDNQVLFPTVKAGEQEALDLLAEDSNGNKINPAGIGDNFVVYVDNVDKANVITGYRNGNQWYSASGIQLTDGKTVGTSPLLVDKSQKKGKQITTASFKDYTPQTNIMPRIAFSFPISDEALFFAHYDILTKRPTTGLRMNPSNYYFIENIGNNVISNPSLKPEKTIDYEVGFQQALSTSSSIKISTFYREQRNMVQVKNLANAYPKPYTTYTNIDFSTVKGMTMSYDLRRTNHVSLKLSYTLQFADGTGSNSTQSLSLVRAGQSNLRSTNPLNFDQRHTITGVIDYRYGGNKNYDGPVLFGKNIFANAGANFTLNAGSGTPYNRQLTASKSTGITTTNSSLMGKVNGSRNPWNFRIDARVDRDIQLSFGGGGTDEVGGTPAKKKKLNMNVYLQVFNLFNIKNITSVYRFTGNADDDGYLASAQFQQLINTQNNPQSFRELYNISVNNPTNFQLPRRIRVGLIINL